VNAILTIAAKDLRLLARDSRSAIILLVMPLLMIAVLGLSLGEGFGQKADERIRISIVNLDSGLPADAGAFPGKPWSTIVLDDLADTADIRIELIASREEAEALVKSGRRSCVIVLEADFSRLVHRCSFTGEPFKKNPINPLYRDGMKTRELGMTVLRDPTQQVASAVIEQVMQVTLMRVVIPWMIGQAFELIGTDEFMARMDKYIQGLSLMPASFRKSLGSGIQRGISGFFSNYNFTAKSWSGLTNSQPSAHRSTNLTAYESDGRGVIKRGAVRYQILVPTYTVTFAFFLVLTVGWLFVAERRHGTLVRLRAAPISRGQILIGKMLPCLAVSLIQGTFLLVAGRILFGMSWGPEPWLIVPVVLSTASAAVGLSMLVAAIARTETQVAVYGTLLVLMLAGISGSLMPRDLMPESLRELSRITPHAWALDAYSQILANPEPQANIVMTACGALLAFAILFLSLAWWRMRLD
jgi:ABC-2 type transport system permease protein